MPYTYYGSPDEPIEELADKENGRAPQDGDILCDGHQAHYMWSGGPGGRWI